MTISSRSLPDAADISTPPCGKPGRSGSSGNKNARTHGMYSLKRAVQERGLEAIDGRSALGRALREYRADLVRDLGGEANLSTLSFISSTSPSAIGCSLTTSMPHSLSDLFSTERKARSLRLLRPVSG